MAEISVLVERLKYRLSRQQDSSIDARIVAELAAAQESLECGTTLPWFLLTQASLVVSGAHDTFSLLDFPDFLRISEDGYALRVQDTSREDEQLVKLVRQDTYEQLLRYGAGVADAATFPETYCVLGSTVHVRKKQVASRTYFLSYYRKDPTYPNVGVTTLWSQYTPDLLMAEAGVHVAQYLRDAEAKQLFAAMRAAKYAELIRRNQALQDADENYVMDE